jgi:hypothetical protein
MERYHQLIDELKNVASNLHAALGQAPPVRGNPIREGWAGCWR